LKIESNIFTNNNEKYYSNQNYKDNDIDKPKIQIKNNTEYNSHSKIEHEKIIQEFECKNDDNLKNKSNLGPCF